MNRVSTISSGSTDLRLRPNVLNFAELLAQNVALISPTMTAALIVPLMYSNTGNLSWLSYAVGTVMLLFVAANLNQFAKRGAGTGSMYSYACSGLGVGGGTMCGWCLIWAYLFIGLAGTTGFTIFAGKLLDMVHLHVPAIALFAVCIGSAFLIAFKDIKVSTIILLALEGFSCFFILLLCLIVLGKAPHAVDSAQFNFKELSPSSLGLGVVVAIFSLVGFESSTAFGEEAIKPLQTIPRSIIWSLVATGLFFIFVSYIEVLGTHGYPVTLDKIDAPLNVLASRFGVGVLIPVLSAGAMFSFFALALSCMNAGARVMFAMGRHEFFHKATSKVHESHATPHFALGIMALAMFSVIAVCRLRGMDVLDAFNDAGTMGAFGFLGAYFLVTLAAPAFLKKRGELKASAVLYCAAAVLLMLIPAVGSVYPVPAPPVNLFPYIFLAYVAIGLVRTLLLGWKKPERHRAIHAEMQSSYAKA
jgi:amino acid transporter